jgi:hypothetical protein
VPSSVTFVVAFLAIEFGNNHHHEGFSNPNNIFLVSSSVNSFLVLQLSLETTIDYHQAFTSLGLQNKQGRKSKCGI